MKTVMFAKFWELVFQGQREIKVILQAQISPGVWIAYFKNKFYDIRISNQKLMGSDLLKILMTKMALTNCCRSEKNNFTTDSWQDM